MLKSQMLRVIGTPAPEWGAILTHQLEDKMSDALSLLRKCIRCAIPLVLAALAFAAVLTHYPSEKDPGPPFYARIERGFVIQDGTTAAIPFYRGPACIPPRFNLLNLFDAPRVSDAR
jgi:hypothetical protein